MNELYNNCITCVCLLHIYSIFAVCQTTNYNSISNWIDRNQDISSSYDPEYTQLIYAMAKFERFHKYVYVFAGLLLVPYL